MIIVMGNIIGFDMTLKQLRKLLEQLDAEEKVAVIPGYKTYYGCW